MKYNLRELSLRRAERLNQMPNGKERAAQGSPDGDVLEAVTCDALKAASDHQRQARDLREQARDLHRSAAAHNDIAAVLIAGVLERGANSDDQPATNNPPGEDAPAGAAPLSNSYRAFRRLRQRALRTLSAFLTNGEKITIN